LLITSDEIVYIVSIKFEIQYGEVSKIKI